VSAVSGGVVATERVLEPHEVRILSALSEAEAATANAMPLRAVDADRWRIQQHLARVEATLRDHTPAGLAAEQRVARARNLDVLHEYWVHGVFPRNSMHPGERRPYFIDDEGRACAVAHLIIESGEVALAQVVDRAFHTERVLDMNDARLVSWATHNGFSVPELALIQPNYCICGGSAAGGAGASDEEQPYDPVCGENGLTYWNECAADLCGAVEIAHQGECESPRTCELCGVGDRLPVVSECGEVGEGAEGVCGLVGNDDIVAVNEEIASYWLELQSEDCPTGGNVHGYHTDLYVPWNGVEEDWDCPRGGGSASGGSDSAASKTKNDDSGCSLGGPSRSVGWRLGGLTALALAFVRCRRQFAPRSSKR
jgi:hypothetical protein